MKTKNTDIQDLLTFLNDSPTAWHAVENAKQKLLSHHFTELKEGEKWSLQKGKKYFVVRNGSSLCAFITPSQAPQEARILASHTDSPSLKLKPKAEFLKQNMVMLGVEPYGAPLLSSWLNRDLGIAGRVVYLDTKSHLREELVTIDEHPLVIPQLAIHLDRKVNDEGLLLNKQEHLSALATINSSFDEGKPYLETLIREKIAYKDLLSFDLFLYPLEKARLLGYKKELLASYRLDSLGSVHAALTAIEATKPQTHLLQLAIFWDHEEVGSASAQGAASPFLSHLMERICYSLGQNREDYFRLLNHSFCVSVDLAHALHPNYPERHDPRHQPLLGEGTVVKSNSQQRYATSARTSALIEWISKKHRLPIQHFVSRSDIPCGSTIGPIQATLTGIQTVDIGYSQLSMHSIRELIGCQDHLDMCRLLSQVLTFDDTK